MQISDFWCGFLACMGIELALSLFFGGITALVKREEKDSEED